MSEQTHFHKVEGMLAEQVDLKTRRGKILRAAALEMFENPGLIPDAARVAAGAEVTEADVRAVGDVWPQLVDVLAADLIRAFGTHAVNAEYERAASVLLDWLAAHPEAAAVVFGPLISGESMRDAGHAFFDRLHDVVRHKFTPVPNLRLHTPEEFAGSLTSSLQLVVGHWVDVTDFDSQQITASTKVELSNFALHDLYSAVSDSAPP